MIRSGFFNSMNGDRKYDASKFAEYFASFIGNGVFPDSLQVVSNNNMTVTVKSGKAWINGYIMINDADYILNINAADGVLNRIDRIVLRYDAVDREIRLEVKQGTFAASPVAPALQRDADAYELCIADITVSAGAISITQDKITDRRFDSNLCGKVDTLIAGDYLSVINAVNNKLDKTGDSKDNKVTFTEAAADADIASGDTHSTLFGKILKNLNTLRESIYNIVNGGTTVGKAVTLNGLLSSIAELNFVKGVTSAIQTQLNGKAPTNHSSTGTSYGLGTTANYGHVKVRNDLIGTETSGATVSPAQIKLLDEKFLTEKPVLLATIPLSTTSAVDIQNYLNNGYNPYDEYILELSGSITIKNINTTTAQTIGIGFSTSDPLHISLGFTMVTISLAKNSTDILTLNIKNRLFPSTLTKDNVYSNYKRYLYGAEGYTGIVTKYSSSDLSDAAKYFRIFYGGTQLQYSANTLNLKIYGIRYAM